MPKNTLTLPGGGRKPLIDLTQAGGAPSPLTVPALRATPEFDYLVFIGRFRPFHVGHLAVICEGLRRARKVIILNGSAFQARSPRNPFTYQEVVAYIRASFGPEDAARLEFRPIPDAYNNNAWIASIQLAVRDVVRGDGPTADGRMPRVGLIGHAKDGTSYYLRLFPQWGDCVAVENVDNISATDIRLDYYKEPEGALGRFGALLPSAVAEFLQDFSTRPEYEWLTAEHEYYMNYRRNWEAAPYPPFLFTADTVAVQSGHVLLIERRSRPGQGLLALPGGFVRAKGTRDAPPETVRDAAIRTLVSETNIRVHPNPDKLVEIVDLRMRNAPTQIFDHPYRSERGRVVSVAHLLELRDDASGLPKVSPGDSARRALWVPIADLDPEIFFEDHYHIIRTMLKL